MHLQVLIDNVEQIYIYILSFKFELRSAKTGSLHVHVKFGTRESSYVLAQF